MPPKQPASDLTWIEIDDFTPGLITNSGYTNATASTVPGKQLGQAQVAVGCIALPNGGLAPGPGLAHPSWSATQRIPPAHFPFGQETMMVGLFSLGRQFYNVAENIWGDEILIGLDSYDSVTGQWTFWLDSLQTSSPSSTDYVYNNIVTFGPYATSSGSPPIAVNTMTGAATMTGQNSIGIGAPTWFLEHTLNITHSPSPSVLINYPNPDPLLPDYDTFTPYDVTAYFSSTVPWVQVLAHQNREVTLWWIPLDYSSANWELLTNEVFNYSDPPNALYIGTVNLTGQNEAFVQEDPTGYGAWGSISASELFLVKQGAGGVVISGDLNSPTVTRLPGVTPTYGLQSRTAQTPIGLIYASNNRGLWTWNGGNTSQKISEQLEDDFFVVDTPFPIYVGPSVDICRWGDWVIVSNDYLYDTNTNSWWQLPIFGPDFPHLFYAVSGDGSQLYAGGAQVSNTYCLDVYSRIAPSNTYTWESYPIRPPSAQKNKQLDIREVVVRASGSGTIQVALTGDNETAATFSPSGTITVSSGTQPQVQRVTTGLIAQDVTVKVVSTGDTATSPAPVVYSVAVGYVEASAKVNSG